LSLIFVSLGAAAGFVGASVLSSFWLRVVGGALIIGFGLQMTGLLRFKALVSSPTSVIWRNGK